MKRKTRRKLSKKWKQPSENLQANYIVLVIGENKKRGFWKRAEVGSIHPGEDGFVRVVGVKLADGTRCTRPVTNIFILMKRDERSESEPQTFRALWAIILSDNGGQQLYTFEGWTFQLNSIQTFPFNILLKLDWTRKGVSLCIYLWQSVTIRGDGMSWYDMFVISTPTRWTVESAVYVRKWDFEIIAFKVYLVLKLFLLCSPVED